MTQILNLVNAVDSFIIGCKSDGIWTPIKASCIMAGWSNLSGALTPLAGAAPSGINLASGTYNRITGLKGDGAAMYLNSNRQNNSDPQNSRHMAVFATVGMGNSAVEVMIGSDGTAVSGVSLIFNNADDSLAMRSSQKDPPTPVSFPGSGSILGFIGHSRTAPGSFTGRLGSSNNLITSTSQPPDSGGVVVFARTAVSPLRFSTCRLTFYSIGESLNLALLDSRVSGLMVAISGAIA